MGIHYGAGRILNLLGICSPDSIIAAFCSPPTPRLLVPHIYNPEVSFEAIHAPHISATQERIRQGKVVLLVQDTTELDLTRPKQQVQGAGPLYCSRPRLRLRL